MLRSCIPFGYCNIESITALTCTFASSALASADEVALSITIETDSFGVFQPRDVLAGAVDSLNNAGTHLSVTGSVIDEIIHGEPRTVLAHTRHTRAAKAIS